MQPGEGGRGGAARQGADAVHGRLAAGVDGKAEVDELHAARGVDDCVLGLDVAVEDASGVEVGERLEERAHDLGVGRGRGCWDGVRGGNGGWRKWGLAGWKVEGRRALRASVSSGTQEEGKRAAGRRRALGVSGAGARRGVLGGSAAWRVKTDRSREVGGTCDAEEVALGAVLEDDEEVALVGPRGEALDDRGVLELLQEASFLSNLRRGWRGQLVNVEPGDENARRSREI